MVVVAKLLETRIGEAIVCSSARTGPGELHKLLRIPDRQHFEQHGIDQAEDRRVRPNAERQRHYDHCCKAGTLGQHPQAMAQVLQERFDHG